MWSGGGGYPRFLWFGCAARHSRSMMCEFASKNVRLRRISIKSRIDWSNLRTNCDRSKGPEWGRRRAARFVFTSFFLTFIFLLLKPDSFSHCDMIDLWALPWRIVMLPSDYVVRALCDFYSWKWVVVKGPVSAFVVMFFFYVFGFVMAQLGKCLISCFK